MGTFLTTEDTGGTEERPGVRLAPGLWEIPHEFQVESLGEGF